MAYEKIQNELNGLGEIFSSWQINIFKRFLCTRKISVLSCEICKFRAPWARVCGKKSTLAPFQKSSKYWLTTYISISKICSNIFSYLRIKSALISYFEHFENRKRLHKFTIIFISHIHQAKYSKIYLKGQKTQIIFLAGGNEMKIISFYGQLW